MKSDFKLLAPSERASLAAKFALNNVSISHDGPQCEKAPKFEKGGQVRVVSHCPALQGTILEHTHNGKLKWCYLVGLDCSQKRDWFFEHELELIQQPPAVDRILADMADPTIKDLEALLGDIEANVERACKNLQAAESLRGAILEVIANYRDSKLAQPNPNEQEEKEPS